MREINGYVKIHRKLLQWGWYQDHAVKEVWLHLLLTAAFRDGMYKDREIKAGQCVVGTEQMAKDLGFTRQQIRTALKKLNSTNEITIDATNKYSIVTLVNWTEYQLKDNLPTNNLTSNITNNQPTNNQQITNNQPHIKNVKNVKNVKKHTIDLSGVLANIENENLKSALVKFVEFRNVSGQPLTEDGLKLMIKKLDNMANTNSAKVEIVNQSVMKGWKDFYKVDEKKDIKCDSFNHRELESLTRKGNRL